MFPLLCLHIQITDYLASPLHPLCILDDCMLFACALHAWYFDLGIESVFLRSPDKGFWACLGDLPPHMPRKPETWVSLCNLKLKHHGISRSSAILGSDSPQSNNRKDNSFWVTPFIPRERPNGKHAIAGYLRLPRPTSAPALMRVLHWLLCRAEEPGYVTGNPP